MSETAHDGQRRRAADAFGLRPAIAPVCPRVVAGKRCHADTGACLCSEHRHLLDHGRIWLDENGRHVLTGEPYDATGEAIGDLTADMTALGLQVRLSGQSMWNPGYTLLIEITAAELSAPPGEAA